MDSEQLDETDFSLSPITTTELDTIAGSSQPFVGQWHQLVSTTNWEKGEIICRWRDQLHEAGVSPRLYSDPAWSRLVGEVSAQHVGRLRRTYQRFGQVFRQYERLYWSHFYAALDWEDAEMWLEGAVQNQWSVAKMRFQRWETLGAVASDKPRSGDIVSSPEDDGLRQNSLSADREAVIRMDEPATIQGPVFEGPDFGEDDVPPKASLNKQTSATAAKLDIDELVSRLPRDVAKSYKAFRASIERLKSENWQTVKRVEIIALINELRQLLRPGSNTEQHD